MLTFLCRNQQFHSLFPELKLIIFRTPYVRFVSTIFESTDSASSSTRDYLINPCDLSPEKALSISQKIQLQPFHKPNSVLKLFKNFGFSKTQITLIVSKWPKVLMVNSDITLKPKMEFLQSLGISGPNLGKLISADPQIIKVGLKLITPSVEYLMRLLGSYDHVRVVLNKYTRILKYDLEKYMVPNVAILRSFGVPDSNVSKLVLTYPGTLTIKMERFSETVCRIKEMGFDPSAMNFVSAVRIMISLKNSIWERKLAVYRELGLSKEDFILMFRVQPNSMCMSEQKIRRGVNFFVNILRWKPSDANATLLMLSMEKRIIPRCTVLGVLKAAGALEKLPLRSALQIKENLFLKRFVTRYQEKIPDVVKAYQGKIVFTGLTDSATKATFEFRPIY